MTISWARDDLENFWPEQRYRQGCAGPGPAKLDPSPTRTRQNIYPTRQKYLVPMQVFIEIGLILFFKTLLNFFTDMFVI